MSDEFHGLRHKLTPEFFDTLTAAARAYGWSGDYTEVVNFVEFIALEAGVKLARGALDV